MTTPRASLAARLGIFLPVAALTLIIDQASKAAVRSEVAVGDEPTKVLPFVDLRHVHNTGIAFSLFADRGWLVILFASLVLAVLVALLLRADDRVTMVGIGAIAGGALGNLVDRVRLGYVTDFIHLPYWPTFNGADAFITAGVVLVVIQQWRVPAAGVDLDDLDDDDEVLDEA